MSALAGTKALIRFGLRRARVRMLVWVIGIELLVVFSAVSVKDLYPTPESLAQVAALSEDNVAAIVFNGPAQALETLGGQVAFQIGSFGLILVGLMSVFMLGYFTRVEEENGRTELLLATAVGRHAPLAAACILVTALNAVVAGLVTAGLAALSLPLVGSVAFGLSFFALGLVFTGTTAVVAQITENSRVVYGSCAALIGVSFVLRAIGDIGDGRASWLSPIGWSQKLRPYAGEQWWALTVPAAVAVLTFAAAWALTERRDVGAGLVQPRPGRPTAAPSLGSPLGLALRLQRGSLIGWSVGLLVLGGTYGSVGDQIDQFVEDNEQLADYFATYGGASLTDAFFTTSALMLALISGGFAIQAMLRAVAEEGTFRAELLLATPASRNAWLGSHLAIAVVGSVIVLGLTGLGMAVTYGTIVGDFSSLPRLVGAELAYLPAVWILTGIALLLYGLVPRAALAAWGAYAVVLLSGLLGDALNLPDWVRALSPFDHTPALPADNFEFLPLGVITAVALALMAAGLAGFRHRDTPV
jgi:ABC-2 type transport system permease protein